MCGVLEDDSDVTDIVFKALSSKSRLEDFQINIFRNYTYPLSLKVVIKTIDGNTTIGLFSMTELPGNPTIIICSDMFIYQQFRELGIAKALQDAKETIARKGGALTLMCTTNSNNRIENDILHNSNWKNIAFTKNYSQDTVTFIWMKDLTREE